MKYIILLLITIVYAFILALLETLYEYDWSFKKMWGELYGKSGE